MLGFADLVNIMNDLEAFVKRAAIWLFTVGAILVTVYVVTL